MSKVDHALIRSIEMSLEALGHDISNIRVLDETNERGFEGVRVEVVCDDDEFEDIHMAVFQCTPDEWWFSTSDRDAVKVWVEVGRVA